MGLIRLLALIARAGRWVLPIGLAAGVLLPGLAAAMKPWLPHMVALLLMLSAFRVGFRQGIGSRTDLLRAAAILLVMQLLVPLAAALPLGVFAVPAQPVLAAALLVLAGSSISGAPNICVLLGKDPALSLRLLLLGTALLPLSAFAVFALWPALVGGQSVLAPVLRLMAVVLGGGAIGFALRAAFARKMTANGQTVVDGLSTLLLAVMVIGLMSAVGPALRSDPAGLIFWLATAFALNFGLQLLTYAALRPTGLRDQATAIAVTAGNRNIALFLVALPQQVIDPLLLFIGCYQIPMFLTPLVMARILR